MKKYYVYILINITKTVLYVGITNNLIKRVYEHRNHCMKGFTHKYNITKLVYYEIFQDPDNAIQRENQIKAGSRKKKIELIGKENPCGKIYIKHLYKINMDKIATSTSFPRNDKMFSHAVYTLAVFADSLDSESESGIYYK